ncbi:MAG: ATP-binding protein [Sarcina sp.]
MFEEENIPFAPTLIESMRSIGYSFEAAIADLLDNSISANAKNIKIEIEVEENPYIVILDDGCGMSEEELKEAMRYGSKNPVEKRSENDLGRFGLGMKSASLSQCRKMVVVSKKEGIISALSWDLDHIIETNSWLMVGYSEKELNKFPNIKKLLRQKNGTYIYLESFDRVKKSTNDLAKTLTESMLRTEEHISLVFHRFIEEGLEIYINNEKVSSKDPFLSSNKKTQLKREQKIKIDKKSIIVRPYILPHISHLSKEDMIKVGGKDKLKKEQGFYIYRNKRLIIWGTWFRLETKQELTKLARVKVDIPNSLDYMWNIDIKKSSASLPDSIKKNLCSCVAEAMSNSERVHNYRGRKNKEDNDFDYIWERITNKDRNGYDYKINREIPQVKALKEMFDKNQYKLVEKLLSHLEDNFPISTMYLDASKGQINQENNQLIDSLFNDLKENMEALEKQGLDKQVMLKELLRVEPYCNKKELIELAKKEWGNF